MLVFITPIRHPHNSTNFRKVEELFEMTLRSICHQSDIHFHVVVVCNSRPNISFIDNRISYHIVDYPPPCNIRSAKLHQTDQVRDKGMKILSGALYARNLNPEYVMFVDSDDLISNQIASFVNSRKGNPGWFIDKGYFYDYPTGRIQRKSGLVDVCGSTLILNASILYRITSIPHDLDASSSQAELATRVPISIIDHIYGDHPYTRRYFSDHGYNLQPLPFRGTAWVLRTGEQYSHHQSGPIGIPPNERFTSEFGCPPRPYARATLLEMLHEQYLSGKSTIGSIMRRFRGSRPIPS